MKRIIIAALLSGVLSSLPVLAQEKKEMPMKEGMPMKSEGMKGGGMREKMTEMQGHIGQINKEMRGMMKGKGMMKSEEMKYLIEMYKERKRRK